MDSRPSGARPEWLAVWVDDNGAVEDIQRDTEAAGGVGPGRQAGATQQNQCQADYDKELLRCGQLQSNKERNACKSQANDTLKSCAKSAREQIKVCQEGCPPKH